MQNPQILSANVLADLVGTNSPGFIIGTDNQNEFLGQNLIPASATNAVAVKRLSTTDPFANISKVELPDTVPASTSRPIVNFAPSRHDLQALIQAEKENTKMGVNELGWVGFGGRTTFLSGNNDITPGLTGRRIDDSGLAELRRDPTVKHAGLVLERTLAFGNLEHVLEARKAFCAAKADAEFHLLILRAVNSSVYTLEAFSINPNISNQNLDDLLKTGREVITDFRERHNRFAAQFRDSLEPGETGLHVSHVPRAARQTIENLGRFISDKFGDDQLAKQVTQMASNHLLSPKCLEKMKDDKSIGYAVYYCLIHLETVVAEALFRRPGVIEAVQIPTLWAGTLSVQWGGHVDMLSARRIAHGIPFQNETQEVLALNIAISALCGTGAEALRPLMEACAQLHLGHIAAQDLSSHVQKVALGTLECVQKNQNALIEYSLLAQVMPTPSECNYLVSLAVARHHLRENLCQLMRERDVTIPQYEKPQYTSAVLKQLFESTSLRKTLGTKFFTELDQLLVAYTGHDYKELSQSEKIVQDHETPLIEICHKVLINVRNSLCLQLKESETELARLETMNESQFRKSLPSRLSKRERAAVSKDATENRVASEVRDYTNARIELEQLIGALRYPCFKAEDFQNCIESKDHIQAEIDYIASLVVEKAENFSKQVSQQQPTFASTFSNNPNQAIEVLRPVTRTTLSSIESRDAILCAHGMIEELACTNGSEDVGARATVALRVIERFKSTSEKTQNPTPAAPTDIAATKSAELNLVRELALARFYFGEYSTAVRVLETQIENSSGERAAELFHLASALEQSARLFVRTKK